MSRQKIRESVRQCATQLVFEKGYVAPVDLLLKMERISPKQLEDWRFKRIPYLERVTVGNLGKLNKILQDLKEFAKSNELTPSKTVYKSWGKGPKRILRFSKTGNPQMEESYRTHYVKAKAKETSKTKDNKKDVGVVNEVN
jgi:hypothetical protein